ncbi:hypothetical protein DNU06_02290 [Putridiphycobacter roseus]|uniref:HTH araC/xylS-type domain-containing protein n=1 Tax=Putridiphycobacter roseus TaxID=2219161 RepID=A0A2W1NV71_9FLAO|nr:AraC family transcriptional regulator [Putridiphycobacter roseus]PZE18678.1 hypothetical protein DNU06_02290 [Putridiphycobacter roseus]
MQDNFHTAIPKSEIIRKYIAYYYFHESVSETAVKSFFYYPHYKNALTIYKDSIVTMENSYTTCTKPAKDGFFIGYTQITKHAAKAILYPPFDKIGVVFQPLGLNRFLNGTFQELVNSPIHLNFNHFKNAMEDTLLKTFETKDIDKKVAQLDAFFLLNQTNFEEKKLEQAITLLLTKEHKYTVAELSEVLSIHRKTLLRLFRKHLNCATIEYIKLIQFRKAVETFQSSIEKLSLTDVAYKSDYYDQTEFIRHFKQLTGFNPKSFFNKLSNYGGKETYWTFE